MPTRLPKRRIRLRLVSLSNRRTGKRDLLRNVCKAKSVDGRVKARDLSKHFNASGHQSLNGRQLGPPNLKDGQTLGNEQHGHPAQFGVRNGDMLRKIVCLLMRFLMGPNLL